MISFKWKAIENSEQAANGGGGCDVVGREGGWAGLDWSYIVLPEGHAWCVYAVPLIAREGLRGGWDGMTGLALLQTTCKPLQVHWSFLPPIVATTPT